MPAPEETTGDPAIESEETDPNQPDDASDPDGRDGRDEAPGRAEAGAARSTRRTTRRLILTAVLVVAAVLAVRGATLGQDGDDDGDRQGSGGQGGAGADRSGTTEATGATTPTTAVTTSSSVAPPDVARPRPAVDLATTPDVTDPVQVARWWAATFVAYDAAEPSADLVARLGPFTATALQDALLARPPAASYDAPLAIAGVSAQPEAGTAPGAPQRLTVAVETPGALVVYRLTLVPGGDGSWQVSEATRV